MNLLDQETGSIEVGNPTDLVALDRDRLAIPASEISEASAVATLLGGEVVHGALP